MNELVLLNNFEMISKKKIDYFINYINCICALSIFD